MDRNFWNEKPTIKEIKEKIKEGHDPVILNENSFDATVNAIISDASFEVIKFLLDQPDNGVNKMTHDGRNYFHWASYRGNLKLMTYLIDKGSNVNLVDDHGFTPLNFAANAGQIDNRVYNILLDAGANIKATTHNGANAIHLLSQHVSKLKDLSFLVQKGLALDSKDDLGNTAFNYAVRRGNITILEELINIVVDYKGINNEGSNAMFYATYGGRGYSNPLSLYKYLDELGIEANIVNIEGSTPLHNLAASTKDKDIIDFFLNKGADINQVNKDGNTAFLNAVARSNFENTKYLIDKIDNINHTNKKGISALTLSVMRNQIEIFKYLVDNGADLKVLDKKGRNLSYYAFNNYSNRSKEVVEQFLTILQENGVSFNGDLSNGFNLYHIAVKEELFPLLKKAKNLNVDINKKNQEGLTPLHIAAMTAKDTKFLNWLLNNGADKKVLTDFDESPYDLAKENELLKGPSNDLDLLK